MYVLSICKCFPRRSSRNVVYTVLIWACLGFVFISLTDRGPVDNDLANVISSDSLLFRVTSKKEVTEENAVEELLEKEPLIDKSPRLSDEEMAADIEGRAHNLPMVFWQKIKDYHLSKNKSCAKYPSVYEMTYNNVYWQTLDTSNGTFYLYSAYYDNRTLEKSRPVIRILGMVNRIQLATKTHCQLWFEDKNEPVFSPVYEYKWIWVKGWGNYKNGFLQPYLMSCKIPTEHSHLIPKTVSLVEKPCNMATTNLIVVNNQLPEGVERDDFAVCVKGFNYPYDDLSVRLVEWLELVYLLGADKIFMYDISVHPNVSKVLSYYNKQDRFEVRKLTLPGPQPNLEGLSYLFSKAKMVHKRLNELIPYNDCLYRNINRYKYIVLLDTDEVIMPRNTSSWKELMKVVTEKATMASTARRSSYSARNVYFMESMREPKGWRPGVPKYMHMMQNIYRSSNYTKPGAYVKCFHDTDRILTIHNHFPFSCIGPGCNAYSMDTKDAHLQHYRNDCVGELKKSCGPVYKDHTELDPAILRYEGPLVNNVVDTLKRLGFLKTRGALN